MKEYCYNVAGHCFSVLDPGQVGVSGELAHYAPFAVAPELSQDRIFRLEVVPQAELPLPDALTEEFT